MMVNLCSDFASCSAMIIDEFYALFSAVKLNKISSK